ncbi:MAG: sugar ABC transporter permease [Candidatus Hydrothermota bacterium]|uniref:Sugar ABC transporter permease n=1 Tax=candidate division WOR-3 bacterium TaxID=2052148 RepID=A0A7C1BE86_UNCW3|nr:MAG: sugar ABC transporter permease [Candidatus Hydrothermae bacterium]HDM90789.1 sugar ABC transporter permease [candidate division WOR-3 bacterium]
MKRGNLCSPASGEALPFILPVILFMLLLVALPVIGTFINSLFRDVPFLEKRFVGFGNFARLFKDPGFRESLLFTALFLLISVSLEMVLGTLFALTMNEKSRLTTLLRVAVLLPWVIPVAVGARIWQLIYNYDYGLLNSIIVLFGGTPVNWLGSPGLALFSVILADVWKTTPFVALIVLTGLKAIPEEVYEQARIDGTNLFNRFFLITFPILRPVFTVALLFRTIDALRVFDVIYVLTGGGPGGSTTSISLFAYRYFLLGDFGLGSASSVVLFLIALSLSVLYLRAARFKEAIS